MCFLGVNDARCAVGDVGDVEDSEELMQSVWSAIF
jgi:hypothetical protein